MRYVTARATAALLLLLVLVACNLEANPAPEPTPQTAANGEEVQINIITATPAPVLVTATPLTVAGNATPASGVVLTTPPVPASSGNAVDWLINSVVIPAWNFLYTFFMRSVGSLFDLAGAQGGVFAQVLCCIVPILVAVVLLARYFIRGRELI
jgi:hypothetical protein